MSKRNLTLFVAVMMCVVLLVTAFVGCDDKTVTYKVTFDSVGGSAVEAVQGVVNTEPAPTKEGYEFGGWYTDAQCTGERVVFPYTPSADVTLYAKWTEAQQPAQDYTVTFDSKGGSAVEPVTGTVATEPVPVKEGWVFQGWYKSGSNTRVKFPYTPTENVTLEAKWKEFILAPAYVVGEIINAAKKQGMFTNEAPFGGSLTIEAGAVKVAADIYMNPANANDVRIGIEVSNNGVNVISVYADDVNMYAVTADANKRFVNVNLAEILKDVAYPSGDKVSGTYDTLQMVLGILFSNGTADGKDGVYTMEASLSGIAGLVELVGIQIPQEILDVIAGINLRLETDVTGGTLNALNLTAVTQLGDVSAKVSEFKIANDYNPEIAVPAKDAAGFDESYLLNFTLEGSVTLGKNNDDYTTSQLVKFDYELRVDFNIVEGLRNCIVKGADGTVTFDASKLFNTHDSRIFLDVYHQCDDSCTDFCAGKVGQSRGSFLTLAYSPEDFGNTDLRAAINLKYLMPQGWIEGLVGELPLDIFTLFGEYTGLNIDLAAFLIQNNVIEKGEALALAGGSAISLPEGINIVDIALDVINFAKQITVTESEGLKLGVTELLDIVADLTPVAGTNIANMIQPFFGGADYLTFKVDNAVYGDPATNGIDIYREFMIISDEIGDYKDFGSRDFAKDIEWVRGNDGNVIITSGDISTHDADGNPIKLTEDEVKTLITSGSAKYTYTDIYGEVNSGTQGSVILKTNGLDFNIVDKPQTVYMSTTIADGGSISGLLSLVGMVMPDLNIQIPGAVFKTDITISSVKNIEFYQPAEVEVEGEMVSNNPYDENKVYKYDDFLNPHLNVKITFSDDTVKERVIDPECLSSVFYNYSNGYNAKVRTFGSFDMVYNAYGQTIVKHVQMADQIIDEVTEVEVKAGQKYLVSKSAKVKYNTLDESSTEKELSLSGTEETMTDIDVEGVTVESYFESGFLGPTFKGVNLTFAQPGTYEVSIRYNYNVTKKYVFTVVEDKVLPGYNADITVQSADTIKVVVSRKDQYGNGVNANVNVQLNNKEGVLTELTAEDYYLYTLVNGEEVRVDSLFFESFMPRNYEFYIKVTNPEYVAASALNLVGKVSVIAPDYDNQVISETEFTDRTEPYTLTIGESIAKSEQASYVGYALAITPVCPSDKAVSGVSFTHEIKLTIDDEEVVVASGKYKFASYDSETSKYNYASFKFSDDGKYSGKDLYVIITDADIIAKIDAATTVNVEYNILASNYNNVVLASASGAVAK